MSKKVIIIGAGGHGKVVADIVLRSGDQVLGFLDDSNNLSSPVNGIAVLGKTEDFCRYPDACFIIAIGNNYIRRKIASALHGVRWYTAIHPTAVISPLDVTIGEGSVVMANAVVNPSSVIGCHCIVNTASVVEHDNRLAAFVHLSVGAKLGGTVSVGENTFVGMGSTVINNITICPDTTVGAGAVVVSSIERPGIYIGIPAKFHE